MVDNSADSMISSATGIFLSFLHAKVGREQLVYFIYYLLTESEVITGKSQTESLMY